MKNLINKQIEKLIEKNINQLEYILIKGLKLKGYDFKNKSELIEFVKLNCKAYKYNNKIIYSVNKEPFLLRILENVNDLKIKKDFNEKDKKITISISNGYFKYI